MRAAPPDQMALLDWTPPEPVVRFDDRKTRAASIAGKLCRAVSEALKEAPGDRAQVARQMSEFLGEEVSKHMLDAYASQAREDHTISLPRFIALIHATRDRRLLELVAEMFGWCVIDRRYLKLIELASLQAKQEDLRRLAEAARRQAKTEGLL